MSIEIVNLFTLLIGVLMIPIAGGVVINAKITRREIRIFSPRLLYPDISGNAPGGCFSGQILQKQDLIPCHVRLLANFSDLTLCPGA